MVKRLRQGFVFFALLCGVLELPGCRPNPPVSRIAAPMSASPLLFTDIAAQAGLHYHWVVSGPRPLDILQTIGNGCAFLDYNNSGNLSILLVGTDHVTLYKGDGQGHFTDVSHQTHLDALRGHFLGCAVGDYDNDGYDDIYISGYRTGILLHNEHGRYFRDVTQEAGLRPQPWGTSCAFAETRPGSGKLDLIIGNYADFGADPKKYQQLCESHGLMTSCGPRYYKPLRDMLYLNKGGGRFVDDSRASGVATATGKTLGVACAPLDGSGRPFLAFANDEMPGDLLQPQPGGAAAHYSDVGVPSGVAFDRDGNIHGGMGIDWGDYDNDGRLDLVVTTFQHEAKSLYRNDGGVSFNDQTYQTGLAVPTLPTLAFGVKFADFSNDGWLDLMIANGHVQDNIRAIDPSTDYRQPTQLFQNVQGQQFVDLSGASGPALQKPIVGRGLAVGDFENNGRLDALVVDSEGAPLLLRNDSPTVGHWITLTLQGVHCNRDGYGALVTATAAGFTQTRLCHADGSYLSSSDKRVHIGLGAATSAESIVVLWPDGHRDQFHNVIADRFYVLKEDRKLTIAATLQP